MKLKQRTNFKKAIAVKTASVLIALSSTLAVSASTTTYPRHEDGSVTFYGATIACDASFADIYESGVATTTVSNTGYYVMTKAQGYIWNDGTEPHGSLQSTGWKKGTARVYVDFSDCLGCYMFSYHYNPNEELIYKFVVYNAGGYR